MKRRERGDLRVGVVGGSDAPPGNSNAGRGDREDKFDGGEENEGTSIAGVGNPSSRKAAVFLLEKATGGAR